MEPISFALAFVAGLVSILSPCVLPLLPVVLGTAVSQHRWGVIGLVAGLALSFLVIGLFVATIGFSIGLDGETFRAAGATMLVLVGVLLMVPSFQSQLALAAGPIGSWTEAKFGSHSRQGLAGQFGVGVLLGAVWSPCVGPTLGAASVLAAQGRDLFQVALTMLLFVAGVTLPLVGLGLLSGEALMRWRGHLLTVGKGGKAALGLALAATGVLLLTGLDKSLESAALTLMPDWLNAFATRF